MDKDKKISVADRIWFKVLMLAISVCFVMFYICVLIWGKNPQVGIEYEMYYITHELSDWPGYGKLAYEYGTVEFCTGLRDRNNEYVPYKVCQRKGQGWNRNQYDGSVNDNAESFIYYMPIESKEDAVYSINVNAFSGAGSVSVYAHDIVIGEFSGTGNYIFDIGNIKEEELLKLKFVAKDCSFTLWSTCIE